MRVWTASVIVVAVLCAEKVNGFLRAKEETIVSKITRGSITRKGEEERYE